jgi:hypothetical protein
MYKIICWPIAKPIKKAIIGIGVVRKARPIRKTVIAKAVTKWACIAVPLFWLGGPVSKGVGSSPPIITDKPTANSYWIVSPFGPFFIPQEIASPTIIELPDFIPPEIIVPNFTAPNLNNPNTAVPEPSTFIVLLTSVLFLIYVLQRRISS